ncbi:MAG: ParB N-terminal domain-containing protein [Elusimicrobiota bacterium]
MVNRDAKMNKQIFFGLVLWSILAAIAYFLNNYFNGKPVISTNYSMFKLIGIIAVIFLIADILRIATYWLMTRQHKPQAEGSMIGQMYQLLAILLSILAIADSLGKLTAFGTFLSLFGGMLLGWSLQAPVSGFAAWVLVSLKRPIRPGDRVQFPSLGLIGDVKGFDIMHTTLNQVGGTVGSEEAVGRYILVPNAMLFSQVIINYTVTQEAAYMLDEVVIRITYDSNWDVAEKILVDAASEVTKDIIAATGKQPYIRSDWYDYGVYLRLRFQTKVMERVEVQYKIMKKIFEEIQNAPSVDLAIPYVYSYRAGADKKDADAAAVISDKELKYMREIDISHIRPTVQTGVDQEEVKKLIESITSKGLLQPIMVIQNPRDGVYDILAGNLRYEACKQLGWKTISAIVKPLEPEKNHH